jgi:hypothetical protein
MYEDGLVSYEGLVDFNRRMSMGPIMFAQGNKPVIMNSQ